ncbi:putative DNA helicase INO80 [Iris pallida]|uniref:DNA helicase INO80 n=1 Tax=Iris pallida TaxID=29817 RepID=A0AAX6HY77_IRIPA|nr:putative DNA helicase INO80 [Iris pallida]
MEGGVPTTGILDLEELPSLHQQQRQQQQLFPFAHEFNNSPPLQRQQLTHAAAYGIGGGGGGGGGNGSRGKQHPLVLGSEDEHAFADHAAAASADAGTKRTAQPSAAAATAAASPWQRMKWTDGMVRLLIMVVYCIGDDGTGAEAADQHHQQQQQQQPSTGKGKKSQATAAGLLLQKKGKWKSVSRAMMEKGFYVSPQQCEDKFNDLNKRYKRVNDLLGKGTACRVVENQSLLDTMDHLSPKAKEEARKLLNSKHLFFREMCAYHNSGGGGGGASLLLLLPRAVPAPPPLPAGPARVPAAMLAPPAQLLPQVLREEGPRGQHRRRGRHARRQGRRCR